MDKSPLLNIKASNKLFGKAHVNVNIDPLAETMNRDDQRSKFVPLCEPRELAIGDLYGNFMKLIYSLQSVGIIYLDPSYYQMLADLEQEHYNLFHSYYQLLEAAHAYNEFFETRQNGLDIGQVVRLTSNECLAYLTKRLDELVDRASYLTGVRKQVIEEEIAYLKHQMELVIKPNDSLAMQKLKPTLAEGLVVKRVTTLQNECVTYNKNLRNFWDARRDKIIFNLGLIKLGIAKIQVNEKSKNDLIHLIGDVVAAQGANDFITLYLITYLQDNGLQFKISFSKRDIFFIINNRSSGVDNRQIRSYLNMVLLFKNNMLEEYEKRLCEKGRDVYLKCLELISYSIEMDTITKNIKKLNVFHHAISSSQNLKALIDRYSKEDGEDTSFLIGIEYNANTVEALCRTIDAVNIAFKILIIENPNVFERIIQMEERFKVNHCYDRTLAPLSYLLLNSEPNKTGALLDDEWDDIEGVPIIAYHGHIGVERKYNNSHRQNINGMAGYHDLGTLYSGENPLFFTHAYPSYDAYLTAKNILVESSKSTNCDRPQFMTQIITQTLFQNSVESKLSAGPGATEYIGSCNKIQPH